METKYRKGICPDTGKAYVNAPRTVLCDLAVGFAIRFAEAIVGVWDHYRIVPLRVPPLL